MLWALLFAAPVLSLYIRSASDQNMEFDWSEVFMVWRQYGIFFAIFLVHNHLLAPMLVYRQRKKAYFSIITVLVAVFIAFQCSNRPHRDMDHPPKPDMEMAGPHTDMMDDFGDFDDFMDDHRPPEPPEMPRMQEHRMHKPIDGPRDIVTLVVLVLMLAANLGFKLYFKQRRDQRQLALLEKQNLEQQLEYLKYQINPHFLMNTLNNIHALVDIDPEQAKEAILELSKLMRFVLYEGNKPTVPLSRELSFLKTYIRLMRMRYSDKVSISVSLPPEVLHLQHAVPPLMFITFVENAFKHGVSYRQASFIDIAFTANDKQLTFTCRNSKIPQEEDKLGGVGLKNVKQRLDLIYGKNYTLNIDNQTETYNIELTLPLS